MSLTSVDAIVDKYDIDIDIDYSIFEFDKYDFLMSAFSGVMTGLIDIFLVGVPKNGILTKLADEKVDELVKQFAKFSGWKPKEGKENNIASAIGFLEKNFKVNYDHRNTTDVNGKLPLSPSNHHFKSLGHSPDPIGLFFSILDQFTNTASFVHNGKLIRIETADFTLYGSTFISKIFCGFVNWMGHIMSDMVGSSGGRGNSKGGRGSGVPIPFMSLFQFIGIGRFSVGKDKNTFAEVMVKVFQEGYDFRHGIAMAIPVIINELLTRALWTLKRRFYYGLSWKECIPSSKDKVLRFMLLISTGTLCVMDGIDAFFRGGGNDVLICLRLNYVAWLRLIYFVCKELKRYIQPILNRLLEKIVIWTKDAILPGAERERILAFYEDLNQYQGDLSNKLQDFTEQLEKDLVIQESLLHDIYNNEDFTVRLEASQKMAVAHGVRPQYILKDTSDLDVLFNSSNTDRLR